MFITLVHGIGRTGDWKWNSALRKACRIGRINFRDYKKLPDGNRNPSLDGRLGILMAANTLLHGDVKSFFHAYVIGAYGDLIDSNVVHVDVAKSEQQSGNPLLYVVSYQGGGRYRVASLLPHEICKITDDEFRRYEAALTSPHQRNTELTGLVNNMIQLIVERLAGKGFAFEDGKLVLPPNYANTRL